MLEKMPYFGSSGLLYLRVDGDLFAAYAFYAALLLLKLLLLGPLTCCLRLKKKVFPTSPHPRIPIPSQSNPQPPLVSR